MTMGILDTVSLAATLVLAIPIALFGIDRIVAGELILGGAFVAIGVGMVLVREKLTTPTDIPSSAAQKVVGTVAKTDEDEEE
ncbi:MULTISPECIES: hypothetical protein [unclassified Haladaptatus]|uniref:DUF7533 family protein n=1 Tax=unclassified Haladaptatus TaxID=2622732 RepID=UPI00209BE793|nr:MULTISPECIES: hypothetical protein [unclassified Haladaptatus]MCO8246960.1 hypothetical protein [Haladaptatus sp. AB643]MCO8253512.1 hypothetical protein [Haladaptatus sp. AB618]